MRFKGQVFGREQLMEKVWGYTFDGSKTHRGRTHPVATAENRRKSGKAKNFDNHYRIRV